MVHIKSLDGLICQTFLSVYDLWHRIRVRSPTPLSPHAPPGAITAVPHTGPGAILAVSYGNGLGPMSSYFSVAGAVYSDNDSTFKVDGLTTFDNNVAVANNGGGGM